mgnify:CR=1 FL=1
MHDLRFYHTLRELTVADVAALTGGDFRGDGDQELITIAPADKATAGVLSFFASGKVEVPEQNDLYGACVTTEQLASALPSTLTLILVKNPHKAFVQAVNAFLRQRTIMDAGTGLGAPSIADDARLHPTAIVSDGAEIGEGTEIGPHSVVGPGVRIGRNCSIGANVVIEAALIGNDVTIKSNTVLGGSGFGLFPDDQGLSAIPHFGRVVIQDRVGIGSNVCIDRGAFDDTVVGENSKLDNLVHIGHNVHMGRNSLMAAFGGVSGSVKIGDWVQMGGRVGLSDHVTIGDGAKLAANSAVLKSVPAGETWGGAPAQPIKQFWREVAWLSLNAKKKNKKD